jgi:hypothetical protein
VAQTFLIVEMARRAKAAAELAHSTERADGVNSEIFRVIQATLRTSWGATAYCKARLAFECVSDAE